MASPDVGDVTLNDTCNAACGCSTLSFDPVCSKEHNVQFFNPCYAGCTNSTTFENEKVRKYTKTSLHLNICVTLMFIFLQVFYDCSCLQAGNTSSTLSLTLSTNGNQSDGSIPFENYVVSGPCGTGDCVNIYFFTILIILASLTIFITGTANQTATLR